MKKITLLVFILIATLPAFSQSGNLVSGNDRIELVDSLGRPVVAISSMKRKDAFSISIGGMDIASFQNKEAKSKTAIKIPGIKHTSIVELGFNFLTKPNYSAYSAGEVGFLDLNNPRSISLLLNLFGYDVSLNKAHNLAFHIGTGILWNDYTFAEKMTLKYENRKLVPIAIDDSYKKSKLNTFSLRVPIGFSYSYKKAFVTVGGYVDLMLGAHTKIKFPKSKTKGGMSYMNMLQPGLSAKVGYRSTYIKFDYNLCPLFKTGVAPKTRAMTVGFGIWY